MSSNTMYSSRPPDGDPMSHEPQTDLFEEAVRQYEEPALVRERLWLSTDLLIQK